MSADLKCAPSQSVTPCHGYRVLLRKVDAVTVERDYLLREAERLRTQLALCQEALTQAVKLATEHL